ncbi:MAG: monovalent cation/H+ antiporter complex subunit F [Candidatus Sumerlaeaceae bacterium]|nr:monovalent cation/H+ antiporter complex subunit F [Candidatus Sumerlaeaceae bacterium]
MFPDSLVPVPVGVAMALVVAVCLVMAVLRFLLGPTQYDRLAAFETFTVLLLAVFSVLILLHGTLWYLDIILVVSVVGFLSTVAYAKFLERGDIMDE